MELTKEQVEHVVDELYLQYSPGQSGVPLVFDDVTMISSTNPNIKNGFCGVHKDVYSNEIKLRIDHNDDWLTTTVQLRFASDGKQWYLHEVSADGRKSAELAYRFVRAIAAYCDFDL